MNRRIVCLYGESGSGKSEAIIALLIWQLKQWRAKGLNYIARVYVADGSLATYLDTGLVINPPDGEPNPDGLIEVCQYNIYEWPLDVTNQIAEGWFPEGGQHGARLVPPQGLKARAALGGQPAVAAAPAQTNYDRVRLWVYEGLQVMGEYIMGSYKKGGLAEQAARGIKIGPDAAIRIASEEYAIDPNTGLPDLTRPIKGSGSGAAYGSNGTAHYGLAQTHMAGVIERTKGLPGWVVWTTHERTAKDKSGYKKDGLKADAREFGGAPVIIGPAVVGDALTATIQKTFNEVLHFQTATRLVQAKDNDPTSGKRVNQVVKEHRIYTAEHLDPDGETNLKFKAIVRSASPKFVKEYYTGTAEEGSGIVKLYEDLAKAALEKQRRALEAAGVKVSDEGRAA
jgi:hypothetical protein